MLHGDQSVWVATEDAPDALPDVIIPSIGRCGSTWVTELIATARGGGFEYARDYRSGGPVRKTHSHFVEEPHGAYRAVYVYGGIGDVICSLVTSPWPRQLLLQHFDHLGVASADVEAFLLSPDEHGWIRLVEGDRLRFRDNMRSWQRAENVMFVRYEALCAEPAGVVRSISQFVGMPLPVAVVSTGRASWRQLPDRLRDAICAEYGDLVEAPRLESL